MSLETGNTIAELVAANPTEDDLRAEGAAHIRLIKAVLKNDVVPKADTALKSELTAASIANVPAGSISAVTVQAALAELDAEKAALAGLATQAFSATTAAAGTNTTQVATTAFVFGMRAKSLSATRDLTAANGNVSYTGLGFRPRRITVFARVAGAAAAWVGKFTTSSAAGLATSTTGAQNQSSVNYAVLLYSTTDADFQYANLASLDADGFTLTWTKGGAPTGSAVLSFFCEE